MITNSGSIDLYWGFLDTTGTPWASVTPQFGNVPAGESSTTQVVMDGAGLPQGIYTATLLVLTNDPLATLFEFPLELHVQDPTSVDDDVALPTSFALAQNYPNPFNPTTKIVFDLPRESHVTISLYNILGQTVGTIVNSRLPAGRHTVDVNASALTLPSGVYLYRMQAGDFVRTLKMTLMK
jgi:hypothetical protein